MAVMLSVTNRAFYAECQYAECRGAQSMTLAKYHAVIFHFIFESKIKGFHNPDPPRKRTIKTCAFWRQNHSSRFYFGNDSSHTISRS